MAKPKPKARPVKVSGSRRFLSQQWMVLRVLTLGLGVALIAYLIVSDFLDENFENALRAANRKHDVIAVLVSDPRELEMPPVGLVAMRDAETGETGLYDTASTAFRNKVAEQSQARVNDLEKRLRASGIDFIHIDAAESVVEPLVKFFRMRERRQRR